jgi:hypothetical protein
MTFTDWFVDITLIALVLRQVRESKMTVITLLLPIGIVLWAGHVYLHGIPTRGHDLVLVGALTAVGGLLGTAAGLLTRVRRDASGKVWVRAGVTAAVLWVVGVGSRLAFQVWSTHGGEPTLARFSVVHSLDLAGWTTAIVLMALAEVVTRTLVVGIRGAATRQQDVPAGAHAAAV